MIIEKSISKIKNTKSTFVKAKTNQDVINEFLKEEGTSIESALVELKPIDPSKFQQRPRAFFHSNNDVMNMSDEDVKSLSFEITKEEITRIFNDIIAILRDPNLVARYLKSLDEELGSEMKRIGIEYDESDLPQFLIPAKGHFIAGPPKEDYRPRKQGRTLERILLQREGTVGINEEGYMPKFVGYVDKEKANKFVSEGHIFAEDAQTGNFILHSKRSHALGLEILRRATEMGELNLNTATQALNMRQLLEMFVKINHFPVEDGNISISKPRASSMWGNLLDSIEDSSAILFKKYNRQILDNFDKPDKFKPLIAMLNSAAYKPENYSYSARSPNVLNSLITCFGGELDLPHLQHYLLNSHYKEAAQIVGRAKEIIENSSEDRISTDFSSLYTNSMKLFAKSGVISHSLTYNKDAISLSHEKAAESAKYVLFEDSAESDPQIKKKITLPKTPGYYESFDDYIAQKKMQRIEENVEIQEESKQDPTAIVLSPVLDKLNENKQNNTPHHGI